MADNFGLKIGVEGEKEFKNSLREINQSFKVLGSEMKLVSSEFDKNDKSVNALSSRNEVLNKSIDAQKEKIATLQNALKNASDSFGENDRRTQNWAVQLNNTKTQLNSMERGVASNEKAIDAMSAEDDDATKQTDKLGNELKDTADEAEKSGSRFDLAIEQASSEYANFKKVHTLEHDKLLLDLENLLKGVSHDS